MRSLALVLALALGGCNSTPSSLSFSVGAQRSWPVDPQAINVNGTQLADVLRATGAGWDDGAGAGSILTDWPKGESDTLRVTAAWVELLTGRAWEATVEVNADALATSDSPVPLVALIGRNGQMRLTQATPATLGQTCGIRMPALDQDLRARASGDQRLSVPLNNAAGLPPPPTPCADPEA